MIPVILSGGSGSRLWPLSRAQFPKQFLSLVSDHTMIQDTVSRLSGLEDVSSPIIVCNEAHRFIVAEQLYQLGIEHPSIMLEPVGKNTAPAISVAALRALETEKDPILLVLAADHVITDIKSFHEAIRKAEEAAKENYLVTFGIKQTAPETGYGYIKAEVKEGKDFYPLDSFVEKPDTKTAEKYLSEGNYFWNSGMFMFKASVYLKELKQFEPEMSKFSQESLEKSVRDMDFIRMDKESFEKNPSNSIDYAVMEKTSKGVVIPLDAGWSDVGSWSALWEINSKDKSGNVISGDVISEGTNDCYLYGAPNRLLATVGIKDTVVIDTKDAILVADKNHVQDIKKIVQKLNVEERPEAISHRVGYRPWGTYDSIDKSERYQVKHITVRPGARLSIQMHHHRAEHWIVVSGTALVMKGESPTQLKEYLLTENQSIYIPVGTVHCLENPGKIPLELIEVQSGSYLNEDDIIRFDDKYGRC